MPSKNDMYCYSNDLLPYRCPSCNGKRFRSLIALRLHTSIIHDERTVGVGNCQRAQQHAGREENLTKDRSSSDHDFNRDCNSSNNEDISLNIERAFSNNSVDKMFDKYSERMDEVLKNYDNKSRKLENKLKLAKQLEEIRRQKQQLHRIRTAWQAVHGVSQLVDDTDAVIQRNLSSDHSGQPGNANITSSLTRQFQPISETNQQPNNQSAEEQLNLSIQLAAKYKALALDAQEKLQEKIVEEKHMKQYIEIAAQKEHDAKQKLAVFMEDLLHRAEDAESKLQFYENEERSSKQNGDNTERNSYNPPRRTKSTKRKSRPKDVPFSFDPVLPPQMNDSDVPNTSRMRYLDKRKQKSDVDAYVEEILEPPSEDMPSRGKSKKRFEKIDTSKLVNPRKLMPFSNLIKKNKNNDFGADRRVALFCVFMRLRSVDLLRCGRVCREWRDLGRHPQLWSRIRFHDVNIDVKLLRLISKWSHETCSLCLKNIGMISSTSNSGTGILEEGLEMMLKSSGDKLLRISIDKCDPFVTSRVLWFVSCYNRRVNSITYRSAIDPLSRDVALALGTVCRDVAALEVAPLQPCSARGLFDNNVSRLLSWCWPQLQAISFGGMDVDGAGLLAVALNCQHLKVLELDHARGVKEEIARTVCQHGLGELHTLLFTHTPIQSSTVLCFLESLNLLSLHVVVAQKDYFTKTKHKYARIRSEYAAISKGLLKLRDHPRYKNIVGIHCE